MKFFQFKPYLNRFEVQRTSNLSAFFSEASKLVLALCLGRRKEDWLSAFNWFSGRFSPRMLLILSSAVMPNKESFNPCPIPRIIDLNSLIFPKWYSKNHFVVIFFRDTSSQFSLVRLCNRAKRLETQPEVLDKKVNVNGVAWVSWFKRKYLVYVPSNQKSLCSSHISK